MRLIYKCPHCKAAINAKKNIILAASAADQKENKGLTNTAKSDEPSELDQHDMIHQAFSRVAQIEQELTELKQLLQQLAQKN